MLVFGDEYSIIITSLLLVPSWRTTSVPFVATTSVFARNLTPFKYTLTPPPKGFCAVYDNVFPVESAPVNVVCPVFAT